MDSIDAQCLVFHEIGVPHREALPTLWAHEREGGLRMKFAGRPSDMSWGVEAVSEMAERWRGLALPVPERLTSVVLAHLDFVAMLETGDLDPPDAVVHDFDAEEIRAMWFEEKVVVVVEELRGARREELEAA